MSENNPPDNPTIEVVDQEIGGRGGSKPKQNKVNLLFKKFKDRSGNSVVVY